MINLKDRFGKKYKVTMDESWDAETTENRCEWKKNGEIAWYYEIHGKRGYIYPQKEWAFAISIKSRVEEALPFETFHDRGTETFHEKYLDQAVEFIQPRKKRVLSPEQRLQAIERLKKFRYSSARGENIPPLKRTIPAETGQGA